MRILVTGATGFLGHAVVASLADRGHDAVALVRGDRPIPPAAVAAVAGDVRDLASMRAAVADVDAVCHLAGLTRVRDSLTDPLPFWRTNVGGALNVLDALVCQSRPTRLVVASTAAVYGTPERQPIDETARPAPDSPYGVTKLAADHAAANVAATGVLGGVSLRAFNIAGAVGSVVDRDLTRLIPKVLAVQAGLEPELVVNGDGSAIRDFVHVLDMAEAFVLALDACAPGQWRAYNVGSGHRSRVADVIRQAEEVTGTPVRIRHAPATAEPPVLLADSSRIRYELGWQPRNSNIPKILSDAWNALSSAYAAQE